MSFKYVLLYVCEQAIPWLQLSEHGDDSDTTLSLPCVFLAITFSSRRVCAGLCIWPLGRALLRLYLLTQNTDKVSNLFSLMKGCLCLRQSLSSILSGKREGRRANTNLDGVTGTKNTLFSDDTCSCTRCAMFTLQRT